jgi:hypothetical protein
MQSILTGCATVLSSLNNALQLPDRLKAARQSKWFVGVALAFAFVAVAAGSWFAHDWVSTRTTSAPTVTFAPIPQPPQASQATPSAAEQTVRKPQTMTRRSKPATGISADPACKDKLRIHMTGGAVTGINGSGIKADNADVCIETNNTKITGGTDGINLDHGQPYLPALSPGELPLNDERRKKGIELLQKYLVSHPRATHEQVVSEINSELVTLGVDEHITWEEPTPRN